MDGEVPSKFFNTPFHYISGPLQIRQQIPNLP
jgi:hypothetical protein